MSYLGNAPGVASQRVVTTITATSGQTTFTPTSGYTLGYADVYFNGVKLVNGDDYTAADGTTIVLASAAAANDVVEIVAHFPRGLSDGYLKSEADARYPRVDVNTQGLNSTQKGNARTNIGAQADLGYTPVNKAGDTITGTVQMAAGNQIRLMNSNNTNWASIDCPSTDGTGQLRLNVGAGAAALFDNSGNMSLPLGNLSLANGKGIDFSSGSNASGMTSELLDDYEVGSFTPSWGSSGSIPTNSPSEQTGRYVKIGRAVHFWIRIYMNTWGTGGSGAIRVSGLPFTAANVGSGNGLCQVIFTRSNGNLAWPTNATQVLGRVLPDSTQIEYFTLGNATGMGEGATLNWSSDPQMYNNYISGTYYTNS